MFIQRPKGHISRTSTFLAILTMAGAPIWMGLAICKPAPWLGHDLLSPPQTGRGSLF